VAAGGTPAPPGLLDAFWAYERALMANDLDELDRWFAPGETTMRGDAAGLLIGHEAISVFRRSRGGSPARTIAAVQVQAITDDAALVIAVTAITAGGRGQQTQLWRRIDGAWFITAAHVALPAPAIAGAIWRVVGTPLVGTTLVDTTLASTPRAAGADERPLAGETVAVKDLFAVAGYAIGAGVPAYLEEAAVETKHASAVAALLAAGATVTGIARTDEFAYSIAGRNSHYGTPPNPAVVGAVPGGSSSGPAAAVASGQASIGLGTDTGGSLRVPASYTGLWGLRTTHGSVDATGLLALAPSFDTIGWLTRDAATLRRAAATSVTGQRDLAPSFVAAPSFLVAPAFDAVLEPNVLAAFHAGLAATGIASSADTIDLSDLGDLDQLFETFRTVQAAESWRMHGEWIEAHPGALGDDIAARFAAASTITERAEAEARVAWAATRRRLDALLGDRVLVLPSASSIAPSATADAATIERTRAGTMRLTCIAGLTGRPALSAPLLSVPCAGQATTAPLGLGFIGPRGSDLALIDLASAVAESARN